MPMLQPDELPRFDYQVELRNKTLADFNKFKIAPFPPPARTRNPSQYPTQELFYVMDFYYSLRMEHAGGELIFPIRLNYELATPTYDIDVGNSWTTIVNSASMTSPDLTTLAFTGVLSADDLSEVRALILSPYILVDNEALLPNRARTNEGIDYPVHNFVPWVQALQPGEAFILRVGGVNPLSFQFEVDQPGVLRQPERGVWGFDAYRIPLRVVNFAISGTTSSPIVLHRQPVELQLGPTATAQDNFRNIWVAQEEESGTSGVLFDDGRSARDDVALSSSEAQVTTEDRIYVTRYAPDIRVGSEIKDNRFGPAWTVASITELGRRQFLQLRCERSLVRSAPPKVI